MILLDTNVLSELTRRAPAPAVVNFVASHDEAWLSVITLHELRFGLANLPPGKRRDELRLAVDTLLRDYRDCILPIAQSCSLRAAELRALAQRGGRTLHLADALIAGTTQSHGLHLATRNVGDFEGLGLSLVNPWCA